MLATHLQIEHNVKKEETTDMVQSFITQMFPEVVKPMFMKMLANGDSRETKRKWDDTRCHYPGCSYLHWRYDQVREHVNRQHKDLTLEIHSLGWFWGTIRYMMRSNPIMTFAEALGQGAICKCRMGRCGHFFLTPLLLKHYFSKIHASSTT
jgi:hypothetical protein